MPKIEEIWAYVAEEKPGDEGVCAASTPMGWMPLVGADKERIQSLKHVAQTVADSSGCSIRLVKFTVRTNVDVIVPRKKR
jgi:hypothetical protein